MRNKGEKKELIVELALKLDYALGYTLKKEYSDKKRIRVIMGSDTRRSELTAGLNSMGINIEFVGVTLTPEVAYLTEKSTAKAGIMILASHNPAKG